MSKKLSVIMSTYNNEDTISKTIESILDQTFGDFEFIIINDGSTDTTADIVRDYQAGDRRIIFIDQENQGLTKSLNIGIDAASGEYIARQDADDISLPNRFLEQVNFLDRNKKTGFLGCSCEIRDEQNRFLNYIFINDNPKKIISILKRCNIFCHGSMMFRRSVLNSVSGYRHFFRYAQDYDLYLRLIEFTSPGSIGDILYSRRIKLNSISIQSFREQDAYARLARTCYEARTSEGDDAFLLKEFLLNEQNSVSLSDYILPFIKSMYCIKNNEIQKARIILNSFLFPLDIVKYKLYLLWLFSYLPLSLRNIVLNTKKDFRKIRLNTELKLNGKRYFGEKR